MSKKIGNYFLLGIAASYAALAAVQVKLPGLLPMRLYVAVAWASLGISLTELIRACVQKISALHNANVIIVHRALDICEKHIRVLSKYKELEDELNRHIEAQERLKSRKEELKRQKYIHWLGRFTNIISCVQIVYMCVMTTLTLVKAIPNNLASNKVVGINSLLSFALLFTSLFLNSGPKDDDSNTYDSRLSDIEKVESYYLCLLDKVAPSEDRGNKKR